MPRPEDTLIAEDFERAVGLIEELHDAGRIDEATAVYKLIVAAEQAGLRPAVGGDGAEEHHPTQTPGDDDLAAGRIIPNDILDQGSAAIEAFRRHRDAGDIDTNTAAAITCVRAAMGERTARYA